VARDHSESCNSAQHLQTVELPFAACDIHQDSS
jgi:hypothetical protein